MYAEIIYNGITFIENKSTCETQLQEKKKLILLGRIGDT